MSSDEKIIHEIYRDMFKASTPSGDWDELLKNATINERGEKEIPFMDYEIDKDEMENIFNKAMKKYRIPKYRVSQFKFAVYLGCSPKTK
jgi:hypothetical protein